MVLYYYYQVPINQFIVIIKQLCRLFMPIFALRINFQITQSKAIIVMNLIMLNHFLIMHWLFEELHTYSSIHQSLHLSILFIGVIDHFQELI